LVVRRDSTVVDKGVSEFISRAISGPISFSGKVIRQVTGGSEEHRCCAVPQIPMFHGRKSSKELPEGASRLPRLGMAEDKASSEEEMFDDDDDDVAFGYSSVIPPKADIRFGI
jgi:hypothetical protein